jgi:hypothetical protein
MFRFGRLLLVASLLLAFAAPVAAVEEPTPEPVPVVVTEMPSDDAEVAPIALPFEGPIECTAEIAAAVAAGDAPIAPAPCLLPDGTLYELASRGTMPNERGDGEDTDWGAMYEQWLTEFKDGLEQCPEGTAPDAVDVITCVLSDGTIVGPMPLFAAMPGAGTEGGVEDIATTTVVGGDDQMGENWLFALGGLVAGVAIGYAFSRRTKAA